MLIRWSPLLSVGIDSIDKQHQNLIKIINDLDDAMYKGEPPDIMDQIFDDLANYTSTHFAYEEMLFEKYEYPLGKDHKEEHQSLINQIKILKEKKEGNEVDITTDVMYFLKDWLTNHILETDSAYAKYLINKGVN